MSENKTTIQLRFGNWELAPEFFRAVRELTVSESEMARRAIQHGFAAAKRELKQEKADEEKRKREVQAILRQPMSYHLPAMRVA